MNGSNIQPERAWQMALDQLRLDMPKASFDTWVRDTTFVLFEDGVFTIGTPNAYGREWLASRLTSTVTRLMTGILNQQIEKRIHAVANERFRGKYNRLEIRFRGQFCYIDAYTEPRTIENWPPPNWPETREEYIERMRSTPVHLCRLRYFGNDQWGFAFYTYSHEKYELSVYPNGQFFGTPEEAFLTSAMVYLNE